MGKIKVRGYAQKAYEANETEYTISFKSTNYNSEDAIKTVKEHCNLFLNKLKENNIDLKDVHLNNDDINVNDYYHKDKKTCTRIISFTTSSSPTINNFILKIIEDNNIQAELEVKYKLKDKETIHKELLRLAVIDSREKADIIASTNNNKVTSIDYLSFDRYDFDEDNNNMHRIETCCANCCEDISNELSNKMIIESEEIFIIWNIE